ALEWREGQGLFAQVELTARAKQYITDGEYRYFSPVFLFDPVTGDVLDLQMGALTNNPAIDGMQALSERAAATFQLTIDPSNEEPLVNPLLKAVLAALGLAENTTEEQAIAALSAHTTDLASMRKQLGLDDTAACSAMLAACTGLKAKAATAVDPAKHVPVTVVDELKSEIA
ncbi:TPA: phage protease, partial [Pseudomonas aeruginosa]